MAFWISVSGESEFRANLGYMRACLKEKQKKKNLDEEGKEKEQEGEEEEQ